MLILNTVACNNVVIQSEIVEKIKENLNNSISQPTVSRRLKKLNITRKRLSLVPFERNSNDKLDARSIYASDITRIPVENLVFLDETGFNKHTTRAFGYSLKNIPAYVNVPANRGTNRSCMCAISINGLITYDYVTGAYNSNLFISFIKNKLAPYFSLNSNKVLIMDNYRFHHTREVATLFGTCQIAFKFLPPYSPQLNPIEEFFSMIKSRYAGIKLLNPENTIEENLDVTFNNNFSVESLGFYRNMEQWLDKARRREIFL